MDAKKGEIISTVYAKKEGFQSVYPWFRKLKK
ncbi:unnamed protein product, partial [marine sediment metagenome]